MIKAREKATGPEAYGLTGQRRVILCGGVHRFAHSNYTSVQACPHTTLHM